MAAVKLNLIIVFNIIILSYAENCHDDPVLLDEEFVGCCRGRPKYTSEPCVDALLENNTLSSEVSCNKRIYKQNVYNSSIQFNYFRFKCIINCIYREFKIYDGEAIDMASIKTFLETQIPQESEFVVMYTNAFETCSKLGNSDRRFTRIYVL